MFNCRILGFGTYGIKLGNKKDILNEVLTAFSPFAVLLLFYGCAPVSYDNRIIQQEQEWPVVQHQYELLFVDIDDHPLEGVTVEYSLKKYNQIVKKDLYVTSVDGIFRESLSVMLPPQSILLNASESNIYKSSLEYNLSKEGYYPKSGELSSTYGHMHSSNGPTKSDKVVLISPIDYFSKRFLSSLSDSELKTKIVNFLDLIILKGILTGSALETRSIDLVSFKGKNYLQFKFTNMNAYNSLRSSKYDIGNTLFDEVIRKILSPLNEYIGGHNLFYGYDLIVIGHTKTFTDQYAIAEPIEYRFIIAEKIVKQYKNKDLTGQQLLDSSIILMDDERIELKLH